MWCPKLNCNYTVKLTFIKAVHIYRKLNQWPGVQTMTWNIHQDSLKVCHQTSAKQMVKTYPSHQNTNLKSANSLEICAVRSWVWKRKDIFRETWKPSQNTWMWTRGKPGRGDVECAPYYICSSALGLKHNYIWIGFMENWPLWSQGN